MTSTTTLPNFDVDTDVCVIGAGLSGLVAAHRLRAAGLHVTVVEARDEPGGRTVAQQTRGGRTVVTGGVYLGETMPRLLSLLDELDVPFVEKRHAEGADGVVLVIEGERLVMGAEYDATESYDESVEAATEFDALIETVDRDRPWLTPEALALDSQTAHDWLEKNVEDPAAREALREVIEVVGPSREASILFCAWAMKSYGGTNAIVTGLTHFTRTSDAVEKLAAPLGDDILLSAPVRKVVADEDGAVVVTDRGVVRARAVIVAIPPQLCAAIEWEPQLPPHRAWFQESFHSVYGAKLWAFYETPWWEEEGLSGLATGIGPFALLPEMRADNPEGVLTFNVGANALDIAADPRLLSDAAYLEAKYREIATEYLGERGGQPVDVHVHAFRGGPFLPQVVGYLPPGQLSTMGDTLHEPVGRILWAGAESSTDHFGWLEGAIVAAERAVEQARGILATA